jgi:cytoskeletal protein CcmA (bactofilin family)
VPKEAKIMETPKTAEFAHIGKSVIIKGELSGSEDLYVDGQVEGSIELSGNRLIIGPQGQVRANVNAKGVIVQGKLDGNIRASERAELTKSAIAVGDIITQRIAIEEGAFFKGKVDIQKDTAQKDTTKTEGAKPAPAASASAAAGSSSAGGTATVAMKTIPNDGK